MSTIAGFSQVVGIIMLFTPFWGMGIICILVGGFFYFLSNKVSDHDAKRTIERNKQIHDNNRAEFEKNFALNPLSKNTETAFNQLSRSDKLNKHFSNYSLPDEMKDTSYKKRMNKVLDEFERGYISKGEEFLRNDFNFDGDLLGNPDKYRDVCDYVGRLPIPELLEDFSDVYRYESWKASLQQETIEERVNFLRSNLRRLQASESEYRKIKSLLQAEYRKKYDEQVELRSINGQWTATNIIYSNKPIDL